MLSRTFHRRSFAQITQVLGNTFVDIELTPEEREEKPPKLHTAFKLIPDAHNERAPAVLLEIVKDLGKFTYRAMPITEGTEGMRRGQEVLPVEINLPVDGTKLGGRTINVVGEALDGKGAIESEFLAPMHGEPPFPAFFCPMYQLHTGVKAIDLLCPFFVGGKNGIVGFPGKTTLLHTLMDRLEYDFAVYGAIGSRTNEICAFLDKPASTPELRARRDRLVVVNCGMGEPVGARARTALTAAVISINASHERENVMLFLDDISRLEEASEEIGAPKTYIPNFEESMLSNGKVTSLQCMTNDTKELLGAFDTTLFLSSERAKRGLFPAIDPFASQSSLMDSTFLGERHVEIANAVVSILHRERELSEFIKTTGMTDDFTEEARLALHRGRRVSKYLTQDLEQVCTLEQTIQDCEDILAGKYDDLPEADFFMIGHMPPQQQQDLAEEEEEI